MITADALIIAGSILVSAVGIFYLLLRIERKVK